MTGAVLDRPDTQQFELDGGLTFEELLNTTLETTRATGSAECPVCHGCMTYTRAGAECGACGSRLT
jgi:DnaJ-class molecular chaperone